MKKLNIVILGASGYTGAELLRLLLVHPHANIVALSANAQAGQPIGACFPHLQGLGLPDLCAIDEIDFSVVDVVFCCLPHATTQRVIAAIPEHVRIVDLSADFRLRNIADYQKWYGEEHQAVALQDIATYGLTEYYRDEVQKSRLVANPGCYPTCSLLPILPLLHSQAIKPTGIIIDAKSGVTGAGRSVKQQLLFNEVSEGMAAYNVNQHRHLAELHQEARVAAGVEAHITFVPHLIPQKRGMLATIYLTLRDGIQYGDVRGILKKRYDQEPFVQLLEEGAVPSTHAVRATNQCHINVFAGADASQVIMVSTIDNLMKGASGQALQNMNVMYGFTETLGLEGVAVFP